MTRISNKEVYPDDDSLNGDEFLIGTDPENNDKTKSYPITLIRDWLEANTNGLSQDNIRRVINAPTPGNGQTLSDAINAFDFTSTSNPYTYLNVLDKHLIIFKVLSVLTTGSTAILGYEYYFMVGTGKGNYGIGGDTVLEEVNLMKLATTTIGEVSSTNLEPPVFYSLFNSDPDNPETSVNNYPGGSYSVIDNREEYFIIYDDNAAGDLNAATYKLYLFIGSNGTYGPEGVDTSISADFQLIDTLSEENDSSGITVRKIIAGSVIQPENDDVAQAVARSFRGIVGIGPNEIVVFELNRQTSNGELLLEKYYWTRGATPNIFDLPQSIDNFELDLSIKLVDLSSGGLGQLNIETISVNSSSIATPHVGLNNRTTLFVFDSTKAVYFLSYSNDGSVSNYNLYRFIGANGTYGSGQADTAVIGDFLLIESFDTITPPTIPMVSINGKLYPLIKNHANDDPTNTATLEVNDYVKDVFYDANTIWPFAIYDSVSATEGWKPLGKIDLIPQN